VPGAPSNADIEDMFAVSDYLRLYNWALDTAITASDLSDTAQPILKKLVDQRSGKDFDHVLPGPCAYGPPRRFFCVTAA
jgi:hypothetical protein